MKIKVIALLAAFALLMIACSITRVDDVPQPTPVSQDYKIVVTLSDKIIVEDADNFDGDSLSPRWGGFGQRPPQEGGVVRMDGTGEWNTGIERSNFRADEGIMIDFRYSANTNFAIFFQAGLFTSTDWRQIGVESIQGSARTYANWGVNGPNWTVLDDQFSLNESVWYTLVHRVLPNGRFSTQIWKRDNPSAYIVNDVTSPPDAVDWDNRAWLFTISIKDGMLRLDNYRQLRFPSDFEMPESPPG